MEYFTYHCDNTPSYARRSEFMDWIKTVISNNTFMFFFAVIGIPMIVMGTTEIVKLLIKHRERMAMIEHGMDPYAHERKSVREKKNAYEPANLPADAPTTAHERVK
jgi:hypothetical protein